MLERTLQLEMSGAGGSSADKGLSARVSDASRHPLEARALSYAVDGKLLIDRIDLSFAPEGISVMMGYNGAGKSLLLRLLHGMIESSSGRVLWSGEPVTEEVRRQQAMVFQKPVLLRRTVLANIEFVLKSRGIKDPQQARRVIERVDLSDLANRPARLLSGGEQQRLALGRALALNPRILFLDEATASLDPASMLAIEEIVRQARDSGHKIVMVTHDIGQAKRLADEIIFIHDGRITEQGAADTFFENPASREAQAYLDGVILTDENTGELNA